MDDCATDNYFTEVSAYTKYYQKGAIAVRNIEVTTKKGVKRTIDADNIDYVKPALFECEVVFTDGSRVEVRESFEEVRRKIKEAGDSGGL